MLILPSVRQKTDYHCGPACLQLVLGHYGVAATQKELERIAGTNKRRGTTHTGLAHAFKAYGFAVEEKHHATFFNLKAWVMRRRTPVIVNWYAAFDHPAKGHYAVVTHIDDANIFLDDPEIGKVRKVALATFKQLWFDFDGDLEYERPPLKTFFHWMLAAYPKGSKPATRFAKKRPLA